MKINIRKKRFGATFVELIATLTILSGSTGTVIIGAKYYLNHTDRSECLNNLAAVQKAVRHHQNINLLKVGSPLVLKQIVGPGRAIKEEHMKCPTNGSEYQLMSHYPPSGIAAAKCTDFDGATGKIDPSKNHTHTHNYNW